MGRWREGREAVAARAPAEKSCAPVDEVGQN